MRLINTFFLIVIVGTVAFLSFFWLGSYEQKMELNRQLPFSFIFRFFELSGIGLIGIGFLILFNYFIKKLILKEVRVSGLKKLAFDGSVAVGVVALIGTIIFFF
ncbi:hypothetical protein IRZ83_16720 [Flavobacterium sp. JLP]|uniref:hypothetical protein n=1 Tax=unclassified Flavobacterium TaxID=196869 RepID=UPI00188D77E8|nr:MULTISPECIES: hypothetical protein [unclassified Flavobacterium]MBF4493806.1 hypothetical protein [Flavobacterium sp. MR2016-29]MBF4508322.1 hypothetical protein [Flavobacterium sp. JLP]